MPNGGISPPGPDVRGRLPGRLRLVAACRYLPGWKSNLDGTWTCVDLDEKKDEGRLPRARHIAERSRRRNPGQLIQFWRAPDVGIMWEKPRKEERETTGERERRTRDAVDKSVATEGDRQGQAKRSGKEREREEKASRKGTRRKKEGESLFGVRGPGRTFSSRAARCHRRRHPRHRHRRRRCSRIAVK